MQYSEVQSIAKQTMAYIKDVICPGMKLTQVRQLCEQKMLEMGADSFWYWDVGAFCFSGDETTVSVSGRTYETSERLISEKDIVTIDLSPQNVDTWGDYARTIILENGKVVEKMGDISNEAWRNGLEMEEKLHEELYRFVTEETTFEELYFHMNRYIAKHGYQNLDFSGNLGHSIVRQKQDRIYIEKGNHTKLSDVAMFTFEPHISTPGSVYGYKKENIYYFENGKLTEL